MKPILFIDFYVLSQSFFWRSLDVRMRQKINTFLFTQPNLATRSWMKGVYTSEEINRKIADKFGLDYEILWQKFVEDCKTMDIPLNLLRKIQDLRSTYLTVLVTDNMDCFTRFTVPAFNLDTYFDYIASSSIERMLKNENGGELFRRLASGLRSSLDRSILIDDSEHVGKIFNELGGRHLLVNKDNSTEYWLDILEKM